MVAFVFLLVLEAASGFEPEIKALQASALPLGQAAQKKMERETGFEPATSTLARLHSTTELFPLNEKCNYLFSSPLSMKKIMIEEVF